MGTLSEECLHNSKHKESTLPGKSCFRTSISAKIQPTDQTSTAEVYSTMERMSSGARYQRVATYWVITSVCSYTQEEKPRAMPRKTEKTYCMCTVVKTKCIVFMFQHQENRVGRSDFLKKSCTFLTVSTLIYIMQNLFLPY